MFEVERIEDWRGQDVIDSEDEKVGKLEEVFTDIDSKEPSIGSVKTGLFGRKLTLVPLEGAILTRDHLRLPYTKDQIKGAPQADGGGQLDGERERDIFNYYGVAQPESTGDEARTVRYETAGAAEERHAEADDLRAKAAEHEQQASKEGSRAADAEATARDALSSHDEAAESQTANANEAEALRQKADEIERR
jgi:hypothetical protein